MHPTVATCAKHLALVVIGACYSGSTFEGVLQSSQQVAIGWYSGTSLAGPAMGGFSLSLTPSRYRVPLDGQIEFAFELRNASDVKRSAPAADTGSPYWMRLTNRETGNGAVLNFTLQRGASQDYQFAPGTSQYVWLSSDVMRYFPEPGTYEVQIGAGQPRDATQPKTLRSNVLTITILPRTDGMPAFAFKDPSGLGPTGSPHGGLALGLEPTRSAYHAREPMWVVVELRDVADRVRSGTRYVLPDTVSLSVVNKATGATVARKTVRASPNNVSSAGGAFILTAFSSAYSALRLDSLYQLDEPGTYVVRLSGLHVRSNDGGVPVTLSSNAIEVRVLSPRR